MNDLEKASLHILAGVNGAGKTTLYGEVADTNSIFINPDEIAKQIAPDDVNNPRVSVKAGRLALQQIDATLKNRQSFVYETTLSSHQALNLFQQAKNHGYSVVLHYVGLDDRELSADRVAMRVQSGGHDIPREALMRRYDKSMDNLPKAMLLSDAIFIYNNSHQQRELLCRIIHHKIAYQSPSLPEWADTALKKYQTISALRLQALDPHSAIKGKDLDDWETAIFKANQQEALAYHAHFVSQTRNAQIATETTSPIPLPSREKLKKHFGFSKESNPDASSAPCKPDKKFRPG